MSLGLEVFGGGTTSIAPGASGGLESFHVYPPLVVCNLLQHWCAWLDGKLRKGSLSGIGGMSYQYLSGEHLGACTTELVTQQVWVVALVLVWFFF